MLCDTTEFTTVFRSVLVISVSFAKLSIPLEFKTGLVIFYTWREGQQLLSMLGSLIKMAIRQTLTQVKCRVKIRKRSNIVTCFAFKQIEMNLKTCY